MVILFMALGVGCPDIFVEFSNDTHPLMLREVRLVVEAQELCEKKYPAKPCVKQMLFNGHTEDPQLLCSKKVEERI